MVLPLSTSTLLQNRDEFLDRTVKLVIDHMKIILFGHFELATRVGQSAIDRGVVVGPSLPQSGFQNIQAWSLDEDQDRTGYFLSNLEPPLDVDHQQDTDPLSHRLPHGLGGCAVEVAMDVGVF
jgi:hypothetical protein